MGLSQGMTDRAESTTTVDGKIFMKNGYWHLTSEKSAAVFMPHPFTTGDLKKPRPVWEHRIRRVTPGSVPIGDRSFLEPPKMSRALPIQQLFYDEQEKYVEKITKTVEKGWRMCWRNITAFVYCAVEIA